MKFQKQPLGPSQAIYYSVKEVWFVTVTSLNYLGKMITGICRFFSIGWTNKNSKNYRSSSRIRYSPFFKHNGLYLNKLGFNKLFPIPMLDGGHLMFYLIEKILGRPLSQKIQEGFFRIGLFLLFSLMFFVTFNDLKELGLF